MRPERRQALLLAATALACWPVWGWYLRRVGDCADDALAVVSLLLLLVLSLTRRGGRAPAAAPGTAPLLPGLLALLAYAASYPFVPRLISAGLAFLALGFAWSLWRHGTPWRPWVVGLGLLSLPMAASLQFYVGYPLRLASGMIALVLLRLGGFPVLREGVYLRWGNQLVMIDAPCSGIRMLWASLLLACCLAGLVDLRPRGACLAVFAAAVLAVLANGLRTAGLFWLDTSAPPLPEFVHGALGAGVFLVLALALLALSRSLTRRALALEEKPCAP